MGRRTGIAAAPGRLQGVLPLQPSRGWRRRILMEISWWSATWRRCRHQRYQEKKCWQDNCYSFVLFRFTEPIMLQTQLLWSWMTSFYRWRMRLKPIQCYLLVSTVHFSLFRLMKQTYHVVGCGGGRLMAGCEHFMLFRYQIELGKPSSHHTSLSASSSQQV